VSIASYVDDIGNFLGSISDQTYKEVNRSIESIAQLFDSDGGDIYQGLDEKAVYNLSPRMRSQLAVLSFKSLGLNLSAALLSESLSGRTTTLFLNENNKKYKKISKEVIKKIQNSDVYDRALKNAIDHAEKNGKNNFVFNSRKSNEGIEFGFLSDIDLGFALHKVDYVFSALKVKNLYGKEHWDVNTIIHDEYDFAFQQLENKSRFKDKLTRLNNMFFNDINNGILSEYELIIEFSQSYR